MRHQVAGKKLGRGPAHRRAMRRTLMKQFLMNERIRTTKAKAQSIRSDMERLVTLAKRALASGEETKVLNARRKALSRLHNDQAAVKKLFDVLAPRYENRPGGYTRIYKLGLRKGDVAKMVLMEFVEGEEDEA